MSHYVPLPVGNKPFNNQNHGVQKDPPSILVMKRESIRTFPDGSRVAMYFVKELNKHIPIAYSDNNPWASSIPESFIRELECNILDENDSEITLKDGNTYSLNLEQSNNLLSLYNELNEGNRNELINYIFNDRTCVENVIEFINESSIWKDKKPELSLEPLSKLPHTSQDSRGTEISRSQTLSSFHSPTTKSHNTSGLSLEPKTEQPDSSINKPFFGKGEVKSSSGLSLEPKTDQPDSSINEPIFGGKNTLDPFKGKLKVGGELPKGKYSLKEVLSYIEK